MQDIHAALVSDTSERETLTRFAEENPGFAELTRQRAVSYWNEYYRRYFSQLADYPGVAAIALVEPPTHPVV